MSVFNGPLGREIFTASDIRVSLDGALAALRLADMTPPVMLRRGAVRESLCEGCGLFGMRGKPACPSRETMHCSLHVWQIVTEGEPKT